MGRKVLVLNADYRALTVCSVSKAFLLVYMNKAEVVRKVENEFLRSVTQFLAMPSVIRLFSYVSVPYKGVMLSRQNIFRRDGHKCLYCGSREDLTLDHVQPRSRGGKTSWQNLVTACKRCNSKKGDFTPEEANMRLPYMPFKPSFVVFLKEFAGTNNDHWSPFLQGKEHKE
ncbi:MAG: HNH endonuclease [Thermoflexibacteraceae bacterium]|jgi:5-methylcytosine-specific restriction endonuclease McrA